MSVVNLVLQHVTGEAAQRAAVSRAYYACFGPSLPAIRRAVGWGVDGRGWRSVGGSVIEEVAVMAKTAAEMVAAAKGRIENLSVEEVAGELERGEAVLVDLR